ncbi:hypothetical protein MMC29_006176 [Sticta canariensis]|nr:hypothetical protein [Sticta canariensis]
MRTRTTEPEDVSSLNSRLQDQWDDLMRKADGRALHAQVCVLLISWEEVDEEWGEDEAEALAHIFENLYQYRIYRKRLTTQLSAQIQLTKFLADLIFEEDSEGTLLIIYYAGNGTPDTDGRLLLAGSSKSRSRGEHELNLGTIVWDRAESLIHDCLSDVLLIFDCCCAGALGRDHHRGRKSRSRIFEYIGATGPDGLTQLPGPNSFTSALIWALRNLSSREGGFTTSQLLQMILQAPNFPKGQMPVLLERGVGSVKRLILAPLKALPPAGTPGDANLAPSEARMNTSTEADEESSEQWRVDLRLLWQDLPTADVIKRLADELSKFMITDDISVRRIEWKGLSHVRSDGLSTPEGKSPAMLGVAQLMALRWQNRVLKKKIESLSLLSKLSRAPSSVNWERSMAESRHMIADLKGNPIGAELSLGPERPSYLGTWPNQFGFVIALIAFGAGTILATILAEQMGRHTLIVLAVDIIVFYLIDKALYNYHYHREVPQSTSVSK